jgi:hypothetical protein
MKDKIRRRIGNHQAAEEIVKKILKAKIEEGAQKNSTLVMIFLRDLVPYIPTLTDLFSPPITPREEESNLDKTVRDLRRRLDLMASITKKGKNDLFSFRGDKNVVYLSESIENGRGSSRDHVLVIDETTVEGGDSSGR